MYSNVNKRSGIRGGKYANLREYNVTSKFIARFFDTASISIAYLLLLPRDYSTVINCAQIQILTRKSPGNC
jgi:hypothetical protein